MQQVQFKYSLITDMVLYGDCWVARVQWLNSVFRKCCCGVNLIFLALPALTPVPSVSSAFGHTTKKRQKKTVRPQRQCHLKDQRLQPCLVSIGILKVSYLLDCTLFCC